MRPADTFVEVLALNRLQLALFRLGPAVAEDMRRRAVRYPTDEEVSAMGAREASWGGYREDCVRRLDKSRWPVGRLRIKELHGGQQVVLPPPKRFDG